MTTDIRTPQTSQQTVDLLSASLGIPSVKLEKPTRLLDLCDGLHERIPPELYHARELGVVSNSALKEAGRSMRHYYTWSTTPSDDDTKALFVGRAFHVATLEPDEFAKLYLVAPKFGDLRKTANKDRRESWCRDHGFRVVDGDIVDATDKGRELLDAADHERIVGMVRSVREHPLASRMIAGGKAEVTALWTDSETGLRCKSRMDYYVSSRSAIFDLKSTTDASLRSFSRDVFNYGYHRQHALYRSAVAALGVPAKHFVFIAVEKEPPYAVATYQLDDVGIAAAHRDVRAIMTQIAECVRTSTWPAYPTNIQKIETPKWAA